MPAAARSGSASSPAWCRPRSGDWIAAEAAGRCPGVGRGQAVALRRGESGSAGQVTAGCRCAAAPLDGGRPWTAPGQRRRAGTAAMSRRRRPHRASVHWRERRRRPHGTALPVVDRWHPTISSHWNDNPLTRAVVPVADHRAAGGLLGQGDLGGGAAEGVLEVPAGAGAQDPGGPGAVAVPVAGEAEVVGAAEADAELGGAAAAGVAEPEGARRWTPGVKSPSPSQSPAR